MRFIEGGVCAAQGFKAAAMHVGVKTHAVWKKDLALIVSNVDCAAAAMFTQNVVRAAPVLVSMKHLADGRARAIIVNSGNANACAPNGEENAERMCRVAAEAIGCKPENVAVASTGVIGQTLKISVIEEGVPALHKVLERSNEASDAAAHAIMTTDTVIKEAAVETVIGGKTVRIGGIAKGGGMIHPNMGTMLCFLTTDCSISPEMVDAALRETVRMTFNRISVDGETSTNDTCLILANGLAGNDAIAAEGADYEAFLDALKTLCTHLVKKMAADGEGCRHLITCSVTGAADEVQAETITKSVISSILVKAAIFGADANWGRVLCAMGYSGAKFDPEKVDVSFASAAGHIAVCRQGRGLDFDEDLAQMILTEHDVEIHISMGEGAGSCTCWGCDITYDYIKVNGNYRNRPQIEKPKR